MAGVGIKTIEDYGYKNISDFLSLSRLTNANHDGVTQQIDDRLQAYTTDNQMLTAAAAAVAARTTARAAVRAVRANK